MQAQSMTTGELKIAIKEDLESLKNLDLDIMPAKEYYSEIRQLYSKVFLMILGTILFSLFFPCIYTWAIFKYPTIQQFIQDMLYMTLLCTGLSILIFMFVFGSLNDYILIKNQLQDKLKTGKLIVEQMQRAGKIAYSIFAVVTFVPSLIGPGAALFSGIAGFFISGILTSILVEMEIKRIGITVLFNIVSNFFDQDKNKDVQQPIYPPKRYD